MNTTASAIVGETPVGDRIGAEGEWHALAVRVAGDDHAGDLMRLRALERWLAVNHGPRVLFHPDGRPRSEMVCLAVPAGQSDKALAFRAFCGGLGLAGNLVQWRIVDAGHAGSARTSG